MRLSESSGKSSNACVLCLTFTETMWSENIFHGLAKQFKEMAACAVGSTGWCTTSMAAKFLDFLNRLSGTLPTGLNPTLALDHFSIKARRGTRWS